MLKTLDLIFFSQPPLCSAPTFFLLNNIYGHALLGIYCHSPHHLSLRTAVVDFPSSCLPVSQPSYRGSTNSPSIPCQYPTPLLWYRKQWVSLAAVSILTTEPSTYSLCPVQLPHPSMAPWHLAFSCSTGCFLFLIRELSSSVAIAIAHAKYFSR